MTAPSQTGPHIALGPSPTFPLSPRELSGWIRFGRRGGIGKGIAKEDVMAESADDLMFLQEDEVIYLFLLQVSPVHSGQDLYLGYSEGVVGKFISANVHMNAPLKRPVLSPRSAKVDSAASHTSLVGDKTSDRSARDDRNAVAHRENGISRTEDGDYYSPLLKQNTGGMSPLPSRIIPVEIKSRKPAAFAPVSDIFAPLSRSPAPSTNSFAPSLFTGSPSSDFEREGPITPPSLTRWNHSIVTSDSLHKNKLDYTTAANYYPASPEPKFEIIKKQSYLLSASKTNDTSDTPSPQHLKSYFSDSSLANSSIFDSSTKAPFLRSTFSPVSPENSNRSVEQGCPSPGNAGEDTEIFIFDQYQYSRGDISTGSPGSRELNLREEENLSREVQDFHLQAFPNQRRLDRVEDDHFLPKLVPRPSRSTSKLSSTPPNSSPSALFPPSPKLERIYDQPAYSPPPVERFGLPQPTRKLQSKSDSDSPTSISPPAPPRLQIRIPPPTFEGNQNGTYSTLSPNSISEVSPYSHHPPPSIRDTSTPITPTFRELFLTSEPNSPYRSPKNVPRSNSSPSIFENQFSGSNKLRKAGLRRKSSLATSKVSAAENSTTSSSLTSPAGHDLDSIRTRSFSNSTSSDYMGSVSSIASVNRKQSNSIFPFTKKSPDKAPIRTDYGSPISSKDFEDEIIQLGNSEFQIVKPGLRQFGSFSDQDAGGTWSARSPSDYPGFDLQSWKRSNSSLEVLDGYQTSSHTSKVTKSPSSISITPTRNDIHYTPYLSSNRQTSEEEVDTVEAHRAKELKWIQLMGAGLPPAKNSKKIKALVQLGIPNSVRGRAWSYMCESNSNKVEGIYYTLAACAPQPNFNLYEEQVFSLSEGEDRGEVIEVLRRDDTIQILNALMNYEPALGYSTGIPRIVALLLTLVPTAEEAFWIVVALINDRGYRRFFASCDPGRLELNFECLSFSFLLKDVDWVLASRFDELGIDPSMFLPQWTSNIFIKTLPGPSTLRIIDLYFHDPHYTTRASLAILHLVRDHLLDVELSPSREAVIGYLRNLPQEELRCSVLLPVVLEVKVDAKMIKKAGRRAEEAMKQMSDGGRDWRSL